MSPKRIRQRLQDERGIALVMALGIMTVILVITTASAYFATQNQKSAYYSRDAQVSYSIAEAGLNNAMSRLYAAADPLNASAVPSTTATLAGGTTTYSGSLSGYTWTLAATSSVRNPTGAAPIVRQVSQKVDVVMGIWLYLYSDATTGCLTVLNNAFVAAPLYVSGNLCISNNAHITGSPLQVRGTVSIGPNGSVGYPATPIPVAKIGGGCLPGPHACGPSDDVYATQITTVPDTMTRPPVDFARWYQNASPGPMYPCTSGSISGGFDNNGVMDGSRSTFSLLPSSAYTCTTSSGQLRWVPGNPGVLTISGTIFFDGNITVSGNAVYNGKGTIYASGSVTLGNNAKLCGVAACNATWDTAQNVLMFVAGKATGYGFELSNSAVYQGGAYVVADYHLDNNAVNWGPVVAENMQLDNNAGQTLGLTTLPPGAPVALEIKPASYSG